MSNVSTGRKVGIAARILAEHAGSSRWLGAARSGLNAVVRSWTKVLHVLWLEVTGFFFLAIAAIGGLAMARAWGQYKAGLLPANRLIVAGIFLLLFAYFGISSFWRAHKRKSQGSR